MFIFNDCLAYTLHKHMAEQSCKRKINGHSIIVIIFVKCISNTFVLHRSKQNNLSFMLRQLLALHKDLMN